MLGRPAAAEVVGRSRRPCALGRGAPHSRSPLEQRAGGRKVPLRFQCKACTAVAASAMVLLQSKPTRPMAARIAAALLGRSNHALGDEHLGVDRCHVVLVLVRERSPGNTRCDGVRRPAARCATRASLEEPGSSSLRDRTARGLIKASYTRSWCAGEVASRVKARRARQLP